jgi:hypothetical protein
MGADGVSEFEAGVYSDKIWPLRSLSGIALDCQLDQLPPLDYSDEGYGYGDTEAESERPSISQNPDMD